MGDRRDGVAGHGPDERERHAETVLDAPSRVSGRLLATLMRSVLWPTTVEGHVSQLDGARILAVNHVSLLDGPMVWAAVPRPVHFLVKKEMFRSVFGVVLRGVGQIPIDRSGPDRSAMLTALHALRTGRLVGIFPEGSRGRGDVAEVRTGIAWLALQSQAPVVPVAVIAEGHGDGPVGVPRLRKRMHLHIGEAFQVSAREGLSRRETVAAAAEEIRVRLAAHVELTRTAGGGRVRGSSGSSEASGLTDEALA